jgi:hypothetical protein
MPGGMAEMGGAPASAPADGSTIEEVNQPAKSGLTAFRALVCWYGSLCVSWVLVFAGLWQPDRNQSSESLVPDKMRKRLLFYFYQYTFFEG